MSGTTPTATTLTDTESRTGPSKLRVSYVYCLITVCGLVAVATWSGAFVATASYAEEIYGRNHYSAGWDCLTREILQKNLKSVTLVNDQWVELDFDKCPVIQPDDINGQVFDTECAFNATALVLEQNKTSSATRKIEGTGCVMWQDVRMVFKDKFTKLQESAGRKTEDSVPLYYRYEHRTIFLVLALWLAVVFEVAMFLLFVHYEPCRNLCCVLY